ncbi:MAG: RibD family protein [Pseudanabaena sp. M135S2SP2A07QC]|nr:RibD family protein [Pseudanabaena sp. M090S1SP2A07QC]MCA6506062.1 RibD family protein [Pseudanabaena sp. M172S2SP2A07QC]MCA6518441.1 RibD family protein [Pseudanabaena sp. M110S1SP2A07QC]MCA6523075.1 RibD family protein [Pseudanabaena sp. M051S1SP2A07QC]MCA6527526.1 RibD family protein [Pseudanabaena sp. M179S2SP2A07QC]MCA6530644.1 RibD family protein [Pseudanabaena sp. M125S2SP2A07QC]MCA6534283.1 RibD family protein [Pseudanabaena sp. M176S2SP2A07QC]MCA6539312.1 RibD family protein [Pse
MYKSFYSSHDRIYNFEELAFPTEGVEFELNESDRTAKRPYIGFNMVSSIDGKATTYEGKLTGLGSRPDRLLMQRLRSQFDAVLAGGTTLRQDAFIPTVPPELLEERQKNFSQMQPFGIVISNSGNLPNDHRFWSAGKDLRIALLGQDTSVEPWLEEKAQIFRFPTKDHQIDLKQLLKMLFEQLGIKRLLVEGGPALNYSLISQGLADELFLTLAPHVVGGANNMTVIGGSGYGLGGADLPNLKLRSLYHHESELFLRYQFTKI